MFKHEYRGFPGPDFAEGLLIWPKRSSGSGSNFADVWTNLAERDATLADRDVTAAEPDATVTTERAGRMPAEGEAQGGTAGRSGRPMQQASVGSLCRSQTTINMLPRRLSCRHNSMRVPKFDGRGQLHLWSHRFQTFLTARGLIGAFEPTSDPIRIAGGLGGMEERNRSIYRHGKQRDEKCEKAW